jgi:HK97 family phage major capsid protein
MSQDLFTQAKAKAEEAVKAAEEGRLEDSETLFGEATILKDQAEAAAKAAKFSASFDAPVLPAPLPNGGTQNPTMPGPESGSPPAMETGKAIYQIRYGSEETAIKAVLVDMHGHDYEAKRLRQYSAFVKYLRQYNVEPGREDQALLREIILSPEYALKAIKTGQDITSLKAVMVEAIDNLGGYVVPVDFQVEVIRRIAGMTVMRGRARVQQTSRDRVEIPKLTGGDDQYTTAVRVTWVAETPTAGTADTNLTWGLEAIPVHDVMAETFLSRNVVEDSAVDLVSELTTAFAEATAIDEDNQFLTGDGVGKPTGILINGTTPDTGVSTVNSGAAAAVTADGLIDLEYEIPSQYRANCIWITARSSVREFRQLKAGDGHYLWGSPDLTGEPATFDGFPIAEQEIMPAIAASAYPVLFGDPAGYRIVDRIGMTVERYLDASTARINQVLYIMRRRLGGKLTHPERWGVQLISV